MIAANPLSVVATAQSIRFYLQDINGKCKPHMGGETIFHVFYFTPRPDTIIGTMPDGRTFTLPVSIPDETMPLWTVDTPNVVLTGDTSQPMGMHTATFEFHGGVSAPMEVTETVTQAVWASRRDFQARDFVTAIEDDRLSEPQTIPAGVCGRALSLPGRRATCSWETKARRGPYGDSPRLTAVDLPSCFAVRFV